MRKSLSVIVAVMAAMGVTASLTLTALPAQATSYIPSSSPETCSSGQPKLDYEWLNAVGTTQNYYWSNVCGEGTWTWIDSQNGHSYYLWALRMPTSPSHRIWLHQNADGSGLSACFYSTGNDIYMTNYYSQYGLWIDQPGNIQVSANTSPC
jgi:hypothetical protein